MENKDYNFVKNKYLYKCITDKESGNKHLVYNIIKESSGSFYFYILNQGIWNDIIEYDSEILFSSYYEIQETPVEYKSLTEFAESLFEDEVVVLYQHDYENTLKKEGYSNEMNKLYTLMSINSDNINFELARFIDESHFSYSLFDFTPVFTSKKGLIKIDSNPAFDLELYNILTGIYHLFKNKRLNKEHVHSIINNLLFTFKNQYHD